MIELKPIDDRKEVEKLFCDSGLKFIEGSGCVTARVGEEAIGFCLYDINEKGMIIHRIYPTDDLMLADGILRSTLHVAAERGIYDTFYSDNADEELFRKLNFIKEPDEKRLNINKLFESCCDCNKK